MSEDPGRNFKVLQKETYKELWKPNDERNITYQVTSEVAL